MRVPVSWLREYVPLEMPLEELATRLSISTAEVEGIERIGVADVDGNLGLFRVGRVLDAVKHPNADRLQLTTVDVGEGEPRSIVCGAWNFGAGATVGVALPGAVLPKPLDATRPARIYTGPLALHVEGPQYRNHLPSYRSSGVLRSTNRQGRQQRRPRSPHAWSRR